MSNNPIKSNTDKRSNSAELVEMLNALRKKMKSRSDNGLSKGEEQDLEIAQEIVETAQKINVKDYPKLDALIVVNEKDLSIRDDLSSMEFPIFTATSSKVPLRSHTYLSKISKTTVEVRCFPDIGNATVKDKELWIFALSHMMAAKNRGEQITNVLRFNLIDFFKFSGRSQGGRSYALFEKALQRLESTHVTIDRTFFETGFTIKYPYKLIENFFIIDKNFVQITFPSRIIELIMRNEVLALDKHYFDLTVFERQVYELVLRRIGKKNSFSISLDKLIARLGSSQTTKHQKQAILAIVKKQSLPNFLVAFKKENDVVVFSKSK